MSSKEHDTGKPIVDEVTGVATTGHEWDGIRELNNPLPRWWLYICYASFVWSVFYWVLMPSWPGISGHLRGVRNHSERANVAMAMASLKASRAENAQRLLSAPSLSAIESDPELLQFAMAAGGAAFGDNCATCHGAGGAGNKGYPNLNDDVWLWGGTLDDIKQTITHGIRSSDPESRLSIMPSFGAQDILSSSEVNDLVAYVQSLSGQEASEEAVQRAAPIFQAQCRACHGEDGTGNRSLGAPDLTDIETLFGDKSTDLRQTIYYSRNAVMPNWNERLDEATITSLAVYVHTLGGGE